MTDARTLLTITVGEWHRLRAAAAEADTLRKTLETAQADLKTTKDALAKAAEATPAPPE